MYSSELFRSKSCAGCEISSVICKNSILLPGGGLKYTTGLLMLGMSKKWKKKSINVQSLYNHLNGTTIFSPKFVFYRVQKIIVRQPYNSMSATDIGKFTFNFIEHSMLYTNVPKKYYSNFLVHLIYRLFFHWSHEKILFVSYICFSVYKMVK